MLENRRVSIWGIGYLGYTTVLKMQESGFFVTLFDIIGNKLEDFANDNYPSKHQVSTWSKSGKIPEVDITKVELAKTSADMFKNSIHIVSFPNRISENDYQKLAELFLNNRDKLKDNLVIFQSAGIPGNIENNFIKYLDNLELDVATVFRSDWTIEEFLTAESKRLISGNSENAIRKTEEFLKLLRVKSEKFETIQEAEIYENVKNSFHYTISAFFNQLSLAYPHIDVNHLSKIILQNLDSEAISLGVNGVDYKSEQSIENIFATSRDNYLSILQEANRTNLSFLYYYVDLLKSKNVNSVTIFGIASHGSMKDFRFSPSLILADYLKNLNLEVSIYDRNFSKDEVNLIAPNSRYLDLAQEKIDSDCVIIMNISNEDKFLDIKQIGLFDIEYILDNTGFFANHKFSDKTTYHQFGDKNLVKLVK